MVILGLTLNKVFYKKEEVSIFSATLPLALKGAEAPSPTRPERAEAPSPGHRPGYVVCEPVALKGQKLSITRQKLYNITQPT